jgi:hypothetical protein
MNKQRFLMGKLVKKAAHGYGGTSKGMEGFALRIALDILAKKGLLQKFKARVHDQDASTEKIFASRDDCKHMQMFLDPGHKKKNVLKTIKGILGTKKCYTMLADRMAAFFMRCIKEACIRMTRWLHNCASYGCVLSSQRTTLKVNVNQNVNADRPLGKQHLGRRAPPFLFFLLFWNWGEVVGPTSITALARGWGSMRGNTLNPRES